MRKQFAAHLHRLMQENEKVVFITGDLGFGLFDKIRQDFPERFINTGAAEQAMMGIGVGLALSGKIPVVYSITPFLLWRASETIRNYIDHEFIPVKMVGSGRNSDYSHDGHSHFAGDDELFIRMFDNIYPVWPTDENLSEYIPLLTNNKPVYINLKR